MSSQNNEYVDYSHNVDLNDTGGGRPGWLSGVLIVAGVLVVIAAAFSIFGGSGKHNKQQALPPPPIATTPKNTKSTGTTVVPHISKPTAIDTAISLSIRGGLRTWAQYANDGKLTHLDHFFVTDGPQYKKFEAQQSLAKGNSYTFTPDSISVSPHVISADERAATVILSVTENGSPPVTYTWDIDMRLGVDGAWRIWSVTVQS